MTSPGVQHYLYYSDQAVNRLLGNGSPNLFSPACDPSVVTPGFSTSQRGKLTSLLSPSQSAQAVQWNQRVHSGKSGVRPEDIALDLARYVDFDGVRVAIQQSGGSYTVNQDTVDAVFVEAVHQFQAKVYFHKKEQDGSVGASTLDSLGIVKHKLKPKIGNVYGRDILKSIADKINTSGFNASNWYDFIMAPSFLGHRINTHSQGIHLLLLRELRKAEKYLLSLPFYGGMTPVALGRALGLGQPSVFYSGGRISSAKTQGMHGLGLALDIDVHGNPWIGAGWNPDSTKIREWLVEQIKTNPDDKKRRDYQLLLASLDERYRFMKTLKEAAQGTLNSVPKGSTIFSYLHTLAVQHGQNTRAAYDILARRNEEFKTFLRNQPGELSYWRNSFTFGNRDPLKGFLNLHPDLVFALREKALLAWGAIDFGSSHSGDVMHFDLRTVGAGRAIAKKLGGYIPMSKHFPVG